MRKLIRLNWTSVKCYHIRLLLVPTTLAMAGWYSPIFLVPMSVFLLFSFSLNPFAVEEQCELNRLYLTLPVARREIVAGRYAFSLLLTFCGILLGFALMPLMNLVSHSKWYPDYRWNLTLLCFSLLLYALMSLSMYPLLFKLGFHRGKFWGMYLPMMAFGLAGFFTAAADVRFHLVYRLFVYASAHLVQTSAAMLSLAAVFFTASLLLSMRLYAEREF